ncbi:MAG: phage major capsid protein [Patescibacteria group bacterium]
MLEKEQMEKMLAEIESKFKTVVDASMEEKLKSVVGPLVAQETKSIVEKMRVERALFGHDRSGLDEEQKKKFVESVKAIALGRTKANEALIPEQDSRGGYLMPKEVANAIVRIAASVGLVLSQAAKWEMKGDELEIPNYTGSFLEGEYLGVDAEGVVTALSFGTAKLITKTWQLVFAVNKVLLAEASVNLADWLLALAAESLANMVDKQAFVGTGNPFVGLLYNDDVAVKTLASGKDTFAEFNVVEDSSAMIGDIEESVLDGAAFYMNRTVWASLRVQKDGVGKYLLDHAGAPTDAILKYNPTGGGVKPAGEILGFPVFTCRHLPLLSATAVSTKFLVFGNFKAMAYGDKGEMEMEEHKSGSFGGKEIARSYQRALVMNHRHALVTALPAAFEVAKTAAS